MFKKILFENSYVVGGCIRDVIIGREVTDIDIICICSNEEFNLILKKLSSIYPVFPLDEKRGIWRVSINNLTLDISKINNIEHDILRRDFTINTLAVKLEDVDIKINKNAYKINFSHNRIIDITRKGISDLKKGWIRHINPEVFDDDPLRIMRAIRFLSQFDFKILPQTEKLINEKKFLLSNVAKERIKEEIVKMASSNNFFISVKFMIDTGVLFVIFPEFEKQINCATIYYGKGGVLRHTLNVVEKLDLFFKNIKKYSLLPKKFYPKLYEEMYLIKIAGLFHDIAKPHTAAFRENRLRFFGHENLGSEITQKILYEFKFSNKDIKYVYNLIKNHLRIGSIACNDPITRKAISRVFYDLREYTLGLLVLSWADYSSHIKNLRFDKIINETKKSPYPIIKKLPTTGIQKTLRFIQVVNFIFKNYSKFLESSHIKSLLNGNEIMNILSLPSGPQIGRIKRKLIHLQLDGKIKNRTQAVSYIKSLGKNLSF
ncbi:MAG: HD domain-containing protein [Elusimicrobiales bacterium]|nr:HD domain-containing protein [Elusimicrobiales bacterium]